MESEQQIAQFWLDQGAIFIDTETTALDGEMCDLGIVAADGTVLLNTLVKPSGPISAGAEAIHHISNEMVEGVPTFLDLFPQINDLCRGRLIVAYNATFDLGIFRNSALKAGLYGNTVSFSRLPTVDGPYADQEVTWEATDWKCAMKLYARFRGVPGRRPGEFKWWKQFEAANHLGIAVPADLHRAAADAALTCRIVRALAEGANGHG